MERIRWNRARSVVCVLTLGVVFALAGAASAQSTIDLLVGQSKVITGKAPIRDVLNGSPDIVGGRLAEGGTRMEISGLKAGRASLRLLYLNGTDEEYVVTVSAFDAGKKVEEFQQLLGDIEGITFKKVGDRIVADGTITSQADRERFEKVMGLVGQNVLNLVVDKSSSSNIQTDVQVVEISDRDLKDLGVDWDNIAGSAQVIFQERLSPDPRDPAGIYLPREVAPDPGRFFADMDRTSGFAAAVNYLVSVGKGKVIARPKLVCKSGGQAEFRVGGEIPIVFSSVNGQTVNYKEFGILLKIQPSIESFGTGNLSITVAAERSAVDPGLTVAGNPGFASRRVSTELFLRDGETVAMAGLLQNTLSKTSKKLPILGAIPVLGDYLFGTTQTIMEEQETFVFITPHIISDVKNGENIKFDREGQRQEIKDLH